jgi:hypothetical protein
MLTLMATTIYAQRAFSTMFIAERKTQVYKRTDGGPGSTSDIAGGIGDGNQPRKDQPLKLWNMLMPLAILVCKVEKLKGYSTTDQSSHAISLLFSDSLDFLLLGTNWR